MLSKEAEEELLAGATCPRLREDLNRLAQNRQNPFLVDGEVDVDRYISFLNDFNEFINHQPKPLSRMIDKVMKL